jgi:16S rRNA (cytidine1402-2'-O)-methyltransferase
MELVDFFIDEGADCRLCLCNDLTKLHEMSFRGTPAEVKEQLLAKGNYDKGEYAVVMEISEDYVFNKVEHTVSAEAMLVDAMVSGNVSAKEAVAAVMADENNSYSKNELKAAALNLKRMFGG